MIHRALTITTLLALVPAGAQAATLTSKKIASPNKGVRCHALKVGGPGIECQGKWLPDFRKNLDLNSYVQLAPRGKIPAYGERRDYTGYKTSTRTLSYGSTWKRSGITCKLTRSSFTCRNLDRHGFTITKGKLKRF